MYQIVINTLAKEDLDNAIEWYENKRVGLGLQFLSAFKFTVEFLSKHPFSYRMWYKDIRVCRLSKTFPYYIHYSVDIQQNKVTVISVFHAKQNDAQWDKRSGADT